jgi:hypothetical protein
MWMAGRDAKLPSSRRLEPFALSSHPSSIARQVIATQSAERGPIHDAAREQIDDHSDVKPTFSGPDVREVSNLSITTVFIWARD